MDYDRERKLIVILEALGWTQSKVLDELMQLVTDMRFLQELVTRMKKTSLPIRVDFSTLFRSRTYLSEEDIRWRALVVLVIQALHGIFESHWEHYEENKAKFFPYYQRMEQLHADGYLETDRSFTDLFDWGCGNIANEVFLDYEKFKAPMESK